MNQGRFAHQITFPSIKMCISAKFLRLGVHSAAINSRSSTERKADDKKPVNNQPYLKATFIVV